MECTLHGKPFEATFNFAKTRLEDLSGGELLDKIYMIGDNPLSDIKGANTAGMFL